MPPRKKKPATTTDGSPASVPTPAKTETVKVDTAKKAKPSAGSLARRKHALIDELRDENTPLTRQLEIRAELDGALADVPNLSHQELSRLGD